VHAPEAGRMFFCTRRTGAKENPMKPIFRSIGLATFLGVASTAVIAGTAAAAETHQAKVAIADARAKALGLVPGTLVKEELEHEKGRWIYSFEIKPTDAKEKLVKEVNIDSDTGDVVSIATEEDGDEDQD
jgi:uncharacterized membrane protein YkoI